MTGQPVLGSASSKSPLSQCLAHAGKSNYELQAVIGAPYFGQGLLSFHRGANLAQVQRCRLSWHISEVTRCPNFLTISRRERLGAGLAGAFLRETSSSGSSLTLKPLEIWGTPLLTRATNDTRVSP
jgi:hypothetical protein